MNALEKTLINDTILSLGILAVAVSWVVLAAAQDVAAPGAHHAVNDTMTASAPAALRSPLASTPSAQAYYHL